MADRSSRLSRSGSARMSISTTLPPAIVKPITESRRPSGRRDTTPMLPLLGEPLRCGHQSHSSSTVRHCTDGRDVADVTGPAHKEKNEMKIKLTSVYVNDQDKALRFYTEVLGFAKKADLPWPLPLAQMQSWCACNSSRHRRWRYSVVLGAEGTPRAKVLAVHLAMRQVEHERELRQPIDSVSGMIAVADAKGRSLFLNKRAIAYLDTTFGHVIAASARARCSTVRPCARDRRTILLPSSA
jgi:hypothetical protein